MLTSLNAGSATVLDVCLVSGVSSVDCIDADVMPRNAPVFPGPSADHRDSRHSPAIPSHTPIILPA